MRKSKLPYPSTYNKIIGITSEYNIHTPPLQQLNLNIQPVTQYMSKQYTHKTVREGVV